jgi:hypothetical protein
MKWSKRGLIYVPDGRLDWSVTHAQIPLADDAGRGVLRIYFSTRDSQGRSRPSFVEVEADDPRKVLRVNAEPLLPLGEPGTFDDSGIMPFSIVERGSEKRLYYVGWSRGGTVPYHQAIGLAVSLDGGRSFSKYSEGPVCDRSVEEPYFCTAPSVMACGNITKMWYVSCTGWEMIGGKFEPFYLVKYAESDDGVAWRMTGKVCVGYDEFTQAIGRPFVTRGGDGTYKMFYSFRSARGYRDDPSQSYRLGYAESADGITWTRKGGEVGIERSEEGWDSEMIAYSHVYERGGRTFMFYNGNGFGRTGFGYAVLEEEAEP